MAIQKPARRCRSRYRFIEHPTRSRSSNSRLYDLHVIQHLITTVLVAELTSAFHYLNRERCGLGTVQFWEDMTDLIESELVHRILHTYRHPNDVDLYLGGFMEAPVVGSELGPTVHCIIREQFEMLRNGDRFFYTRPEVFTEKQLKAIKKVTLARIFCETADNRKDMSLPVNVFKIPNTSTNPLFKCSDTKNIPEFDLSAWNFSPR